MSKTKYILIVLSIFASVVASAQDVNVVRSLEGIEAGVRMSSPSGAPGVSPLVHIRGISSINAGTEPLYVLDGVPFTGDLNSINSDDVESVRVLKDAASKSLYGSRGANGVILIETRKTRQGRTRVGFNAEWGLNGRSVRSYDYIKDPSLYFEAHYKSLLDYYRLEGGMSDEDANLKAARIMTDPASEGGLGYLSYTIPDGELLIGKNGRFNPNALPGRTMTYYGENYHIQPDDWMDATFRNSLRQKYTVNASGTYGGVDVLASFGYLNDQGLVKGQDMQRYTARVRADYQVLDFLKVGLNLGYSNVNVHDCTVREGVEGSPENIFAAAAMVAPIYPLYIRRSGEAEIPDSGDGSNAGMVRPIFTGAIPLQHQRLDASKDNTLTATGYAELSFLRDFRFTLNFGGGLYDTKSPVAGISSTSSYFNLHPVLSWKHTFDKDHNVSASFGQEWHTSRGGILYDKYNNVGFYLTGEYDYRKKIFAEASFRFDASSRYLGDMRGGCFWSLRGGWLIDKEYWFYVPWVDMLKLKGSFGTQGNDNIYGFIPERMYSASGTGISWEKRAGFDVGADFELLDRRLSGTVEYFFSRTSGMLYFSPSYSSVSGGYYDNLGRMRNMGVELTLKGGIIRSKELRWDAFLNITHDRNKVASLPYACRKTVVEGYEGFLSGSTFIAEGLPLNTFLTPQYAGVDKTDGLPMWYKDVVNQSGDVTGRTTTKEYSEATDYLCGSPNPAVYGGFGTSVSYREFDFSALFAYQVGGRSWDYGYAAYMTPPGSTSGANFHVDVLDAWSPENPDSDVPRFVYNDRDVSAMSDRFLLKASYLSLKNVQLGYTFPKRLTDRVKVEKLRVYLSCDNLGFWSCRRGFDPRYSFYGETNHVNHPAMRTVSAGVNFSF